MNNALCGSLVILSRYLMKEVFNALMAVTFVLLLIFLSKELVRYLSYAAMGKIAPNILFQLLGFEVPYLLALLLPLGLYLGIILAYGRLYADHEMIIMQSSGLSGKRLSQITSVFTVGITLIVFILVMWVNPFIAGKKEQLLAQAISVENVLNTLMPGRFQVSNDGKRVVYVETISRDRKQANNIFIAQQSKEPVAENSPSAWTVVSAAEGYQMSDPKTFQRFLVAANGSRYEGVPGQNDYEIFQFKTYAVELPATTEVSKNKDVEGLPFMTLVKNYHDPNDAAELQWRLSIPLSAFLLSLLAVPLSHIQPRQGRYSQLFVAILIYVVYVNLLFVARNWVEEKLVPIDLGMWWVHVAFLGLVGVYLFFHSTTFRIWTRRA